MEKDMQKNSNSSRFKSDLVDVTRPTNAFHSYKAYNRMF